MLCLVWTPPRRNFPGLPAWPSLMWTGPIAPIGGAEMLVGEALVEGSQFHQRPWWNETGVSQAACLAEFWKAPATVGESSSNCLVGQAACAARYHRCCPGLKAAATSGDVSCNKGSSPSLGHARADDVGGKMVPWSDLWSRCRASSRPVATCRPASSLTPSHALLANVSRRFWVPALSLHAGVRWR